MNMKFSHIIPPFINSICTQKPYAMNNLKQKIRNYAILSFPIGILFMHSPFTKVNISS